MLSGSFQKTQYTYTKIPSSALLLRMKTWKEDGEAESGLGPLREWYWNSGLKGRGGGAFQGRVWHLQRPGWQRQSSFRTQEVRWSTEISKGKKYPRRSPRSLDRALGAEETISGDSDKLC